MIVGITGGQHCFYDYGGGKVPSLTITSFVVGLFSIAVNFILNKQSQLCLCWLIVPCCLASMVCRSAVDTWNCWRMALLSQLRQQEGAFTHYHIFGSWSLVVSDSLACCKNYDSNALVLFQVQVNIFLDIGMAS